MKFFLDFKSDNYGTKEINEPFGVDKINFSLRQKTNGLGRDVSFSGDKIEFEFSFLRNHELKKILYYNKIFGFESNITLRIEIDEINTYKCDLDFATATTDDLEYFKCQGIEDGSLQIVKSRKAVKVDLFSDKDIDGNFIAPLVPANMFLNSKPIIQSSKWEQTGFYKRDFVAKQANAPGSTLFIRFNPAQSLVNFDLEDSFTFFETEKINLTNVNENPFLLVTAKDNLNKIRISVTDLKLNFATDVDNGGNGFVEFFLEISHGVTFQTSTRAYYIQTTRQENQTYNFDGNITHDIPILFRGESIWVCFFMKVAQTASVPFLEERFEVFFEMSSMNLQIQAESTSYNSIAPSFRLIDVMKQVVRSISGLQINAPRFDVNGEFYDNRLVNGNLLRNITNRGFYVSLEDIAKSINEMYADYEIQSDGKIFFGIYEDYYRNDEIFFFDNTQFSEMSTSFNEANMINEFSFKYDKFQSLKENEEVNSNQTIHGESKLVLFNKNVENKKEVDVQWVRDAYLIESTRKKAIEIKPETASQDDDVLFCIDSVVTTFQKQIKEVTTLKHTFNPITNRLILANDNSINFILLGIVTNSTFIINAPDFNGGNFTVTDVTANVITLRKNGGSLNANGNGIRLTNYSYILAIGTIPFTNYTNEGFSETLNLNGDSNFSNRRYSIARNIYNYYNSYLATCNLFWKTKPLRNTFYKNNGAYQSNFQGVTLKENADVIPTNPILSPVLYNSLIFANVSFETFIVLINRIRSKRGFIRTIDNNGQVIKVYAKNLDYKILEQELSIVAEEKYEPTRMQITNILGYITINNETTVDELIYEFENERFLVFDTNRFRLYNSVYWQEVSINGAVANSIEQLKEWLSLL